MFNQLKNFFDPGVRIVKKFQPQIALVNSFIEEYESKTIPELQKIIADFRTELTAINKEIPLSQRSSVRMRRKTDKLPKQELDLYNKIQEIMPKVYAILKIVTKRTAGISHYDVQLLAGAVLASGQKLVELKTGEGKTMTFQLPLFLYSLTGRGAHLVTVNDYLARRDGEYAGHIFSTLNVTVGIITPQASYKFIPDAELPKYKGEEIVSARKKDSRINLSNMKGLNLVECSKTEAYGCDVVYGTNNEFGFDYLRDNMVKSLGKRVQRELYFCIVDEADSILIDEARTPLIISATAAESNEMYKLFAKLVIQLKKEEDYVVEEKERAVNLTDEGIIKMERLLNVENIWEDYKLAHHLENALKALVFYSLDHEYILRGGEVLIVDEFTGRVLSGRRYSEGLHQAIEAKEGVQIQNESRTLATITFQNFFRIYKILVGGSGTIMTEQEEFFKIYNLEATEIPTHKTLIREDKSDRIYKNKDSKFKAVAEEIKLAHQRGQPILIGTTSISDSELLSNQLSTIKIKHEVLNAKFHEREAQIVAKAGEVNAVTVATNMAGRGTDIPLGEGAASAGGLYVIGTERHESRRIDNQLRGRSGRQGDPGLTRFFVALDDQIMKIQGGEIVKRLMEMTKLPDDLPLESRMITGSIERAQKRMEGMYFDTRKHVVEYDDVVNQQREIFYTRRLRYLRLADKFSVLASMDKESEEYKVEYPKAISKLVKQFKEVSVEESRILALEIEIRRLELGNTLEAYKSVVDTLISIAPDQLFISTINKLKLTKVKISTTEKLKEALINQFEKYGNDEKALREFIAHLLRMVIESQIVKLKNHDSLIKAIYIDVMDELWTLHLDYMQDIREGIGLRGVAQLDPLVEYKNEGFKVFSEFINKLNRQALVSLLQINQAAIDAEVELEKAQLKLETNEIQIEDVLTGDHEIIDPSEMKSTPKIKNKIANNAQVPKEIDITKIGRNDLCFCGSGKKYKKCGLINSPEHIVNMRRSTIKSISQG